MCVPIDEPVWVECCCWWWWLGLGLFEWDVNSFSDGPYAAGVVVLWVARL